MTDIEKIIAEHAVNMPHGEFTHESECAEHEEWFKKDVREIVNLAIQEYESLPKVRGWVARDMDGELNFFGSELGDGAPIYDGDFGMWGNATDNKINISRESSPFGDLNYYDDPVEVELLVRRV